MAYYKGFSLFDDLDNLNDRAVNRGRIMANIVVDHQRDGKFSPKGMALSGGYMRSIPAAERKAALSEFVKAMRKEGFVLGGTKDAQAAAIEGAINGR